MARATRGDRARRAPATPRPRAPHPVASSPGADSSSTKSALSRWAPWILAAGLIATTVMVFAPIRHHDFVTWDDPSYVTENANVSGGLTWPGVWWAVTTGEGYYWHPLTWISHMLDVELYGLNAGGHHLTNLMIHVGATIVLFGWLRRVTGALARSAFVAALFAIHPLHVESVAWVAERKDVLSGLFWMLALLAYAGYVRRPGPARYLLVLLCFAFGLMAKPMVVTFPLVLLLLDLWPLRRLSPDATTQAGRRSIASRPPWSAWLRLIPEKLPFVALALASSVVTFVNQVDAGAVRGLERVTVYERLANALVSYLAYIGKTVWPTGLAAFYPYPHAPSPWWVVALLVLVLTTIGAAWAARRRPYLLVGWLWYLVTLVPVIGLIQVGSQATADRFTYVPLVGLFIVVAWGVPDLLGPWPQRRMLLSAAAVLVTAACAVAARVQVQYWKDSETLWMRAAAVTVDNDRAHANLGLLYERQGRTSEAITHYAEAARITYRSAGDLHYRIGTLLVKEGRVEEAAARLSEAARLQPERAEVRNALGAVLERQGKVDEAIAQFSEAVRLQPDDYLARHNLAVALERRGRTRDAIAQYREALRLKPDYAPSHFNLGVSLANESRLDEAIRACLEGLRLDPTQASWHYKLAVIYDRKGDRPAAVQHLETALKLDPQQVDARRLLADLMR